MKVGVFIPSDNREHSTMLMSFAVGLNACGVDYTLYDVHDYHEVDVAVVFGIGKKDVPCSWARGAVIAQQMNRNKNCIVIEKGFIKRDEYYMVGWNGLNNHANFNNSFSPSDRWDNLGVELKPYAQLGNNIVVCCQVPTDASVQNVNIIDWCANTIKEIRNRTDKNIVFRPHPLAIDRTPSMFGAIKSTKSFEYDLKNAWAIVTYNSNAAVEAVISGVPALSFDHGSMAWVVTDHDLSNIEAPLIPVDGLRKQWVHNLAYAQWNKAEFEQGLPWKHLTNLLKRKQYGASST